MVCTMLVRRFDRGVTFVFFANSTLMTTSFLKLPSLPSFPPQLLALPLSRSLSFLVSLSIVGLSFLVVCDSPWWIWWSLFFFLSLLPYRMHVQYGLHGTVVSVNPLYTMVCTMLVRRFDRGVTFVFFCELNIDHHFLPQTSFSSFLSPSASRSTTVSLPLVSCEFEHCWLVVLVDCCLLLVVCDSPWWIWWSLFFFLSLLPYRMHVQYGLHGTVVSVHPLYTIVCTMLVRRFDVAQPNGGCPICLFCEVHVFLFDSDSHYYFLAFFFSLALYEECNSSSFYFALCSKKRVPFSFLVICFRWVCQLSGIQTILGHLREVLSSLSKSNHGVNTGMVCVLVDCQVRYRSLIHTLLRAQLLCAAKEGEGILRFR
jgi:hypothetical protein